MSRRRTRSVYPDWFIWSFCFLFVWALVGILAVIAAFLADSGAIEIVAAAALPGVGGLWLWLYVADWWTE